MTPLTSTSASEIGSDVFLQDSMVLLKTLHKKQFPAEVII